MSYLSNSSRRLSGFSYSFNTDLIFPSAAILDQGSLLLSFAWNLDLKSRSLRALSSLLSGSITSLRWKSKSMDYSFFSIVFSMSLTKLLFLNIILTSNYLASFDSAFMYSMCLFLVCLSNKSFLHGVILYRKSIKIYFELKLGLIRPTNVSTRWMIFFLVSVSLFLALL